MSVSPVRNDAEYRKARLRIGSLMDRTDQKSLDDLEMLSLTVEAYEKRYHAMEAPTPLAAIKFRMEQAGLKPRDLEPFIGSRSRVSEILSGTRALSLDMIRALHRHLEIPADALIQPERPEPTAAPKEPSVPAMQRLRDLGIMKAKENFVTFMKRMVGPQQAAAFFRKSRTQRTNAKTDEAALTAWLAAVCYLANKVVIEKPKKRIRGSDAARKLAQLSMAPDGPALAREQLRKWGIVLVTLEHLPGTYLDGAAMRREDGIDVIAMTLRHDRIDNFWFTLLHEFCHVSHHLKGDTVLILDDLELKSTDEIEDEADAFAQNALIPPELWKQRRNMTSEDVNAMAEASGVNPAIVAGRWQRENNDYRRFSKLLGRGQVRNQFKSRT